MTIIPYCPSKPFIYYHTNSKFKCGDYSGADKTLLPE